MTMMKNVMIITKYIFICNIFNLFYLINIYGKFIYIKLYNYVDAFDKYDNKVIL